EHAYVAKYYADEMAFKAADQCMQIHGGIALTTDLPIEKMWRQQRSYRITEGASKVMKMVIARHGLKTYGWGTGVIQRAWSMQRSSLAFVFPGCPLSAERRPRKP